MPATFKWCESNGSGEIETQDISNLNFGNTDAPNIVPVSNPVTAGNASFEKYLRTLFGGTWTDITNIKFWKSSGDYVAGETLKAAANVVFATPSATPNADSNIPIIEGSALSIESAEGANHIEYGVSTYSAYIRMQLRTSGSTPAGAVNEKEFIFQYDET